MGETIKYIPPEAMHPETDRAGGAEKIENLPRLGWPMKTLPVSESHYPNLPGIDRLDTSQEITWDNLAFVRVVEHGPVLDNAGNLVLQTPYAGTKEQHPFLRDPRTTLHWTINHHVRPHNDWRSTEEAADLPFIIVMPGSGIKETSQEPINLSEVDSFWDHDMILPAGTVILYKPGQKIEIPPSLNGKIHLVEWDQKTDPQLLIAKVLEQLGYTPIKGGMHGSKTDGVNEVIQNFNAREGLDSGNHQFHETNRFERHLSQITTTDMLAGLRYFSNPRCPKFNKNAEELLADVLKAIVEANPEDSNDKTVAAYAERYRRYGQKNLSPEQALELSRQTIKQAQEIVGSVR